MKISSVRIAPYRRQLAQPILTAHGRYLERSGFVFCVDSGINLEGFGDCAPLDGFSTESLTSAQATLERMREAFPSQEIADTALSELAEHDPLKETLVEVLREHTPSAMFAASTALWDLASRREGKRLHKCLNSNAADAVPVNGLLGDGDPPKMATLAAELEAQGYRTFKVKVGVGTPGRDIARLEAICDSAPDAMLRLDANGAWTVAEAQEVMANLPVKRVEFVEQPLAVSNANAANELCHKYGLRLALDEELTSIRVADSLISQQTCDAIVIKPMLVGGIITSLALANRAKAKGIEVIYTSSWESDIGLAATLHLAAALSANPPAMGLSTAGMIAEGIVTNPLKIENGYLKVPEGPGLGMTLAPEILEQLK